MASGAASLASGALGLFGLRPTGVPPDQPTAVPPTTAPTPTATVTSVTSSSTTAVPPTASGAEEVSSGLTRAPTSGPSREERLRAGGSKTIAAFIEDPDMVDVYALSLEDLDHELQKYGANLEVVKSAEELEEIPGSLVLYIVAVATSRIHEYYDTALFETIASVGTSRV